MVKCQGLNEDGGPCGVDLLPDVKFCPECGTRVHKVTILEKPKDTVPCPGTDDGNPCSNKELVQGQKFCFSCAWRVNQSIFEPGSRVCEADRQGTRCTGVIRKHETTCPICTSDKGAAPTAIQKDCVRDSNFVDQTQSPADSNSVDQTESPRPANSKPVDHTQSPADSKPVDQTESPANSKPVDHTQSPADSKPVDQTESPANSKPVDQTESPADSKPVDHTQSPADSKPVDQTQFLNQHKETLTDQHSQNSESLFTDPGSQSTTRTGTIGKPSIEKSANDKPGTPFLWSVAYRDGSLSQAKSPDQSETRDFEEDCKDEKTINKFETVPKFGDQAVQKPALWSVQGKQIPQHSAGQDPQTSDTKLKLLFSEEGEAGGSSGENENKAQHGDIYEGITKPPNQGDNAGSTVKNQLAPEEQGGTSDLTSQTSGAKLNILYGDKNGKAVPEVQSDKNNDFYDPKQMSNSINILQKNEKSSEDQYRESEKRKDNDYHHGDTWKPPTYSILGNKVHTLSEASPKGDAAASVFKSKPPTVLNEAGVTGSGDGPTQKPVSEEDDQGESVTATIPSGPILQHPPEDNSGGNTGSSQKGIFNFTGSFRQKPKADVWQNPDGRFGEGSRSQEVKDDQLYGDNSPPDAEGLKPVGEVLNKSSLFSSVNESKQDKSSKDMEVDPKMTDTASAVSKSDEDSGSSNDEDDNEDDNSLNQKEGETQKKKNKNNSGKKSRREKKKARKNRKKEEKKKEKVTDDKPFAQYKKEKGQSHDENSTSGRQTDPGTSTKTTNSGSSNLPPEKRPKARTHSDSIKVVFHAVFSPSLLANAEGGAYLCLSRNDSQIKMDKVKQFSDGSVEFTAEYHLMKHHWDKQINYSYCVDASPGLHQFAAELFYDSVYPSGNIGRFLSVPKESLSTGLWHQFDGYVYERQESSFVDVVKKKVFGIDEHLKTMKKMLTK